MKTSTFYIGTIVAAVIASIVAIQVYKHSVLSGYDVARMSVICESQQPDCKKLIDHVQSYGYEVLSDESGHYWAEAK